MKRIHSLFSRVFVLSLGVATGCIETPPQAPKPPPLPVIASAKGAPEPPPPPAAARETPDAPFRQKAPASAGAPKLVPPTIVAFTLKSGMRVLLVERHELPLVAVGFVSDRGAGDFGLRIRPGVGSFTGGMLERGTKTRSALELSDAFEALGATHGAQVGWDSSVVFAKVLAPKLEPALTLLADVARNPAFADDEIEKARKQTLAHIIEQKNQPSHSVMNVVAAALYGRKHPYGHALSGRADDVTAITKRELEEAHALLFDPSHETVVVAGDTTRSTVEPLLERALGGWKGKRAAQNAVPEPPKPKGRRIVLVDQPGAAQSQVVFAHPALAANTKDRMPVTIARTILGGMFSSRVNMNLREEHAYTYGAWAYFDLRHGRGPFVAGASVIADKTAEAAAELLKELERMRATAPSEEELRGAIVNRTLSLTGWFESVEGVRGGLEAIQTYHFPLDEFALRPALLAKVTAADVQRVSTAHLHPSELVLVVVGDRAKIEPKLSDLAFGPIELVDLYGDPAR